MTYSIYSGMVCWLFKWYFSALSAYCCDLHCIIITQLFVWKAIFSIRLLPG